MNRRIGWRARTDFGVTVKNGLFRASCRAIELSTTGIVLDRGHAVSEWDSPLFLRLQIRLPERNAAISAVARPVWWFGTQQALKFVRLGDMDRLTLAEHLDLVHKGRADARSVPPWFDFRKVLHLKTLAERRLERVALAAITLVALSGCVSNRAYRALRAEVAVEADAHRRTAGSLERAYRELATTRDRLSALEEQIRSGQADLAEANLNADVVGRERDETNALISQLRDDLSRVGSHLQAFAEDNKELQDELDAAHARLAALADAENVHDERALVLRDLTLALGERAEDGALVLVMSGGSPTVRIATARALSDDRKTLSPDGSEVATAVASVAQAGASRRVVLREVGGGQGESGASAEALLKPLFAGLVELGVPPDRISIERYAARDLAAEVPASIAAATEARKSAAPATPHIEASVVIESLMVPEPTTHGAAEQTPSAEAKAADDDAPAPSPNPAQPTP